MSEGFFVRIASQLLHCHHCAGARFRQVSIPLVRSGSGSSPLDVLVDSFASPNATVFTCAQCGCMQWFASGVDIETAESAEPADAITCPACRNTIFSRAEACSACGWTWHGSESE